jgi:hypothetical protein
LKEERNRLASVVSEAFGDHLAEKEDHDSAEHRANDRKLKGFEEGVGGVECLCKNIGCEDGEHRRTRYLGYVVAYQKCCKRLLKIIEDHKNALGTLFTVIGKRLDLDLIYCRECTLGSCKISSADNTNNKDYPQGYTVWTHEQSSPYLFFSYTHKYANLYYNTFSCICQ